MNIFQEHIDSGKIAKKEDLRRYFWILAKKLHPDVASTEASEKKFIQLKNDYDEALAKIAQMEKGQRSTKKVGRKEVIEGFHRHRSLGVPRGHSNTRQVEFLRAQDP